MGQNPARSAHSTGPKIDDKPDRALRIIAGPAASLDPINFLVDPADPKIAAANAANARYWKQAERKAMFQRDTPPLNVIGGYRFPGAPSIDLSPPRATPRASAGPPIGDSLDVPDFLDRRLWREP